MSDHGEPRQRPRCGGRTRLTGWATRTRLAEWATRTRLAEWATRTRLTEWATRTRFAGWAPGTGALIGSWLVGAAIARLTGAPAVLLVLGAALVGLAFDATAGWWAMRRLPTPIVEVPLLVTAGERVPIVVRFDADDARGRSLRPRRAVHVVVRDVRRPGAVIAEADIAASPDGTLALPGSFDRPGRVDELQIDLGCFGPAGLLAWRRRTAVDDVDLRVAPVGTGPGLDVERTPAVTPGSSPAVAGRHRGDVDGVRSWRRGDGLTAVHWPTSLRADELVVHDRRTASDERWFVDADRHDVDPARLRRTLDDGLLGGHAVTVLTGGEERTVVDHDDAATIAADTAARLAADADARRGDRPQPSALTRVADALRRPRQLAAAEPITLDPTSRWAAAAAATASMGLLVGALDTPSLALPGVAAAIALGAAVSLRAVRSGGGRPMWMRAAIAVTVVATMAWILVDAADVDSLVAALRGPLPSLLMLLVVLHGFEVVDRRTFRVHLAITLVVATYAAGLRIDAALGWWLAAWGIAVTVSSLTIARLPAADRHRNRHGSEYRNRHRGRRADRRTSHRSSLATVGRVAAWTAAFAVATVAVLAAVPIPDGPARLGLPALSVDAPQVDQPGALVGPDGTPAGPESATTPERAPAER